MARLLTLGVGLVTAVAIIAPALADEPPPAEKKRTYAAPARVAPAPRPEPVRQTSNWTGGQAGGSNGGSFANNAFAEPGSYICPPFTSFGSSCYETPFAFTGNDASYTIGPFLGYRVQFGNFVAGVEGDISWKNANSSSAQDSSTQIINALGSPYLRTDSFTGSLKQGWDGSVRGRLGVLVTPWTLVYGTGGLAFGKVSGSLAYTGTLYECFAPGVGCTTPAGLATSSTSFSDTRVGYTVGGGLEYQFYGPWSARIEYRYTDLGSFSKSFNVATYCVDCANPSPGATIDLHPTFQTVRVGIGLGF
jgi:outer membrane immunogenic protein